MYQQQNFYIWHNSCKTYMYTERNNIIILFLSQEIPSTIGKLHKLTHLNVDRNRLTSLPVEVGKLSYVIIIFVRPLDSRADCCTISTLRSKVALR